MYLHDNKNFFIVIIVIVIVFIHKTQSSGSDIRYAYTYEASVLQAKLIQIHWAVFATDRPSEMAYTVLDTIKFGVV